MCGGGGGGSSGGGTPDAPEVRLTFAPIEGGFRIGNQSDFGNFVFLNITAISGTKYVDEYINIAEFSDDSYRFIGLDDMSNYTFQIIGTLDDGGQQEVKIVFVWEENEEDYNKGGIRPGLDTDGDRRANSVDDDIDGDGVDNGEDQCDDPGDEIRWQSNSSTDNDEDGCRDTGEDMDDDNDGLADTHERERQSGLGGLSCSLLADCDGDTVRDIDEVAVNCVIEADCDNDGRRDDDEEAGCVQTTDCDTDGVGDGAEARGCAKLADCDNDGAMDGTDMDDDGDGLIELVRAAELDAVRYALRGDGRRLSDSAELNTTGCGGDDGITSCSGYELVADISLAAYSGGAGWRPLGNDTDSSTVGCQGAAFNGTFEGNGFMISDLSIRRSGENCVGLFGYIAAGVTIRNLTLRAERVIGENEVGGLVGFGRSARIHSSSVVVGEVSGTGGDVGGLIGYCRNATIISSSVVVGEVRGNRHAVGGLAGGGFESRIVSSSVVAGEVNMIGSWIGGLVGYGVSAQIVSSSVVVGEVRGSNSVGGLVGYGDSARIVSSSVVAGEVNMIGSWIGGLAGNFVSGQVAYSYVVSGSDTNMLVGREGRTSAGVASYWDSETSGRNSGRLGEAKTSDELRIPTGYEGIYADWDDETDIFVSGEDVPLAVWCDRDNSGNIEEAEKIDDNLIWDFGGTNEYPAIRCTPISPADWRNWWSLNSAGEPELNQMLLDQELNK